ncbi:hypothetical protein GWQ29_13970 [Aeromonas sp. 2HA2]|uniref:hypothetical protein n=1 Tax=unclassified Aeromonas TaxID=257493 RepID=UPI0023DDFA84|nr:MULTISPECIES: hypothetical protein [unclassified Aeromonas]MDF2392390.1 hypothetical protein [Aeromonas sp. 2MA4]MDF2410520.1 hypothetical protein [Aeromonas sp. 2HA2]
MEIFGSTITTNVLLVLYIAWYLFGKKVIDAYSSRKGNNRADKEDIGELESLRSAGRQPFDIELEKQKAQAAYIVEEFKESLKIRIETKRKLYEGLVDLKVYTRHFYHRAKSTDEAQMAFDKFQDTLAQVSDFMSCNKHFVKEIDPKFLTEFEKKVNVYLDSFRNANESINSGNTNNTLVDSRNASATELLDQIDNYLEKIFKINPAELPYNKSMLPTANASAD